MIKTLVVTTAIERENIVFNYFLEKVAEGRNMIRKQAMKPFEKLELMLDINICDKTSIVVYLLSFLLIQATLEPTTALYKHLHVN